MYPFSVCLGAEDLEEVGTFYSAACVAAEQGHWPLSSEAAGAELQTWELPEPGSLGWPRTGAGQVT